MNNLTSFRRALVVLRSSQLSTDGLAFMDAVAELLAERDEFGAALTRLVAVLEAAGGASQLSTGVQLGQVSWLRKCDDAIVHANKLIEQIEPRSDEACKGNVPGTQNMCTRDYGHPGPHRCSAGDVDERARRLSRAT